VFTSSDDPYEVLGVPRDATARQIRRRYKKLAVEHHPDRNPDPGAVETFKKVAAAYAILNDPAARRRWQEDHACRTGETAAGGAASSVQQRRAATRRRPLTPEEKRRHAEFAMAFAEAMVKGDWSNVHGRTGTPWQQILAGLAVLAYAVLSFFNKGIPFGGNAIADQGPLPFVFWVVLAGGVLLIFTPDMLDEALPTIIPPQVLQVLGWCVLFLMPILTMLMAEL
jgi:hypothetical protein